MHSRYTRRRLCLAALAGVLVPASASATQAPSVAPNQVVISPALITAGQPSAAALAGLREQGFDAVIYLAPLTVPGAVPDEATLVERQGLRFVHIPIAFNRPGASDFDSFVAAMTSLRGRKVLVHCQVNMRASSMVFLYRAIVAKEPPDRAYEAVASVWTPDGVWKDFIVDTLARHGVAFQPY